MNRSIAIDITVEIGPLDNLGPVGGVTVETSLADHSPHGDWFPHAVESVTTASNPYNALERSSRL